MGREIMKRLFHLALGLGLAVALAACVSNKKKFPEFEFTGPSPVFEGIGNAVVDTVDEVGDRVGQAFEDRPPKIRQPVLPEMLVGCRGHVFVPALGMRFVERGKLPPTTGQFLREERLTPPYRVIPYGARVGVEQSPQRLNIELDMLSRIIGLYCG